jgi:hypothetical protein
MAGTLDSFASRLEDARQVTGPRSERDRNRDGAEAHAVAREINVSGSQVLVALASAVCLAVPLVWTFVRYWLFAR